VTRNELAWPAWEYGGVGLAAPEGVEAIDLG
jgi:hypothetical protein